MREVSVADAVKGLCVRARVLDVYRQRRRQQRLRRQLPTQGMGDFRDVAVAMLGVIMAGGDGGEPAVAALFAAAAVAASRLLHGRLPRLCARGRLRAGPASISIVFWRKYSTQ